MPEQGYPTPNQSIKPTVLLIDLSSILYPLWHMSGSEPDPNWTSRQTVAKVRVLAAGQLSLVAIAADSPTSWRRDAHPTYKANRPPTEAALRHQLMLAVEQLRADGFPIWMVDGYEADDVIASATRIATSEAYGYPVQIATADKDLLQLVNDNFGVTVLSLRDETAFDARAVVERFKVLPEQMLDYLTLVGDSADNIPGIRGIGPKKAADILLHFGTLDRALSAAYRGETTGLARATMAALSTIDAVIVEQMEELIRLKANLPIPFEECLQIREPREAKESPMSDLFEDEVMASLDEALPPTPTGKAGVVTEAPTGTSVSEPPPEPPSLKIEPSASLAALEQVKTDRLQTPVPWQHELEPHTPRDAATLARWLYESRLFPQYGSPQAIFATVLAGRELGLAMAASLRGFHVVEGRPTLAADLIRALVLRSGKAEYFMCAVRSNEGATWTTKRIGDPEPVSLTYTWEDALAAQVPLKGKHGGDTAWIKHKAEMLAKTASTRLARLVYADVIFGLYATEELTGELMS